MKIAVNHDQTEPRGFKVNDIVRNRRSGQLYILTQQYGGYHIWGSLHFDITSKALQPTPNQKAQFTPDAYELFKGTITLSNEA